LAEPPTAPTHTGAAGFLSLFVLRGRETDRITKSFSFPSFYRFLRSLVLCPHARQEI